MTHPPHRIALRRPWQSVACERGLRWTRRFGRPRLAPGEQVWLVLEDLPEGTAARLNGEALAGPEPQDVTGLLRARNELVLETPAAAGPAGDTPGRVALEIRPASG